MLYNIGNLETGCRRYKEAMDYYTKAITIRKAQGGTALHLAAGPGHKAVVKLLLKAKPDVNAKDGDEGTALHLVAGFRHKAVVKLLLEAKPDVNAKTSDRWTALHRAAENGQEAVVKLLLEAKLYVNAKTSNGWIAQHKVAKNRHNVDVELEAYFGHMTKEDTNSDVRRSLSQHWGCLIHVLQYIHNNIEKGAVIIKISRLFSGLLHLASLSRMLILLRLFSGVAAESMNHVGGRDKCVN
jgi:ankyrin repeat protein